MYFDISAGRPRVAIWGVWVPFLWSWVSTLCYYSLLRLESPYMSSYCCSIIVWLFGLCVFHQKSMKNQDLWWSFYGMLSTAALGMFRVKDLINENWPEGHIKYAGCYALTWNNSITTTWSVLTSWFQWLWQRQLLHTPMSRSRKSFWEDQEDGSAIPTFTTRNSAIQTNNCQRAGNSIIEYRQKHWQKSCSADARWNTSTPDVVVVLVRPSLV